MNSLKIEISLCEGRDVAVPEDVWRGTKQIDFVTIVLVQPAEHFVRQRHVPS